MKRDVYFPLRISEEEAALVEIIETKTYSSSKADVWRQALHRYAQDLNIQLPRKKT